MRHRFTSTALGLLCAFAPLSGCAQQASVAPEKVVVLDGVSGRMDHFALDAKTGRLFLAALGNDTVEVIDVARGTRSASLKGLRSPQGVGVAPESGRILVANASDGRCHFYDLATLKPGDVVDLHDDADNVRYDAASHLFWVGHEDGALSAIDASSGRIVARIPLDAHPESFALEKSGTKIFVNIPDRREIVVVDRDKRAITARWPLESVSANYPMALDEAGHRLFVACRHPAKLISVDTGSGRIIDSATVAGDADDVWYDAARTRLYVTGGSGEITVIGVSEAGRLGEARTVRTESGARTSFFDPATGRLFVASPARFTRPAKVLVFDAAKL